MKKQIVLISGMLFSINGFSQTTATQPNGVVVHQAQGVEGTPETKPLSNQIRTLENWNLAECLDARIYLELKLAEAATDEDKLRYADQKKALDKRITELKSAN